MEPLFAFTENEKEFLSRLRWKNPDLLFRAWLQNYKTTVELQSGKISKDDTNK